MNTLSGLAHKFEKIRVYTSSRRIISYQRDKIVSSYQKNLNNLYTEPNNTKN